MSEKALEKCEKRATLAIKISLGAVLVSGILGLLALWTLLNQVTISVGIDKKLIEMDARLSHLEKVESADKKGESNSAK